VSDRLQIARDMFRAWTTADRDLVERLVADDFRFHSPPDPVLDRARYFERCWPHAGGTESFDFKRLMEIGEGEVLVTYEATTTDGRRLRNTEVLTIPDDRITEVEVYFGWNL
jgi:ketosteroid isomerase-like protein